MGLPIGAGEKQKRRSEKETELLGKDLAGSIKSELVKSVFCLASVCSALRAELLCSEACKLLMEGLLNATLCWDEKVGRW